MPNTIPNIIIQPDTVTDVYAQSEIISAGISTGEKVSLVLLGQGNLLMCSSASAPAKIDDVSGYREMTPKDNDWSNEAGDAGLFVYSRLGCTINVQKAV